MSHFDGDGGGGNEMNINTIHDIHDLNLQQGEDIVLKTEVGNDAVDYEDDETIEEDDDDFVNNDAVDSGDDETNRIPNNLTWLPIVYTTRLDEMNIFDKIENYTPNEVAVLIQNESKPQYKQILPIKREPYSFHCYSYMKLYSDIEQLNQKVQTETKLRNEELMSMCKPLKIVLEDINCDKVKTTDSGCKNFVQTNKKPHSTPSTKKKLAKPKLAEKEKVISVAKFQKRMSLKIHDCDSDSDSSDDMPLTMLKPTVINSIEILPGNTTIAFKDKTSMKADIYIINFSKDLCCSYEYNSEKINLFKKLYRTTNTVVCDVCCWVKRENQIKLFSQSNIVKENAISFMRIPHGCLPKLCTCCCILEDQIPMQSSVTFWKMSKHKSETSTEASKLIRKAYSYRTNSQSSKKYAVEPTNFLKSAVIMMKYKNILYCQSNNLGENYEIGMEGDVDNHVKLTENRSLTEEKQLQDKRDRENNKGRQYFAYLICCWFKREEIIDKMSKAHNLSPRACKYLRFPHPCKSCKCRCCCKNAKIGIFVDEKNDSTQPQGKKQSKGIKGDKNNQITIDRREASKIKKVYIDSKKYKAKPVASFAGNNFAKEGNNKNKLNSVAVMVSHRKPETEQTISQSIVEPSIESQPNETVEPFMVPDKLVTSIFEKFRGLKLSVNANGTLTANINTPPEKLLPAEIKILADILARASNQMHKLGIQPEEFCRRVNMKPLVINAGPSTGISNIPVLPKQVITQPSSLLPQELIYPPPLCPIVKNTIENTKDIIKPPQGSKRLNAFRAQSARDTVMETGTCVLGPEGVKQKSHPCKTNQFSCCFPRTTNNSKVANVYSMMSHTGWLRNQSMVSAYNIHFNLEMDVEPEPELLLSKTHLTDVQEQILPKIVNVQSLVDTAPETNTKSNGDNLKKRQADEPKSIDETCKIRVLPPEQISALPTNTQSNMTDPATMAVLIKNFFKPIEPIPGHSQENMFDINSSLFPIQNVNGALASPLQNAGNNFVLTQGINSFAPTMKIPDSGKIWAYIDGKLVELQLAQKVLPNAANPNNIAFYQNYGIPNTGNVCQTPTIIVNNGVPMQGSSVSADTHIDEVRPPTENVETQDSPMNALLRNMLTKEPALPNLPQPKRRYANSRKRAVAPLILAHSKEPEVKKKKMKKKRVLDEPVVSNPASKENLQNEDTDIAIQIIDSNDEEESIFGV